LPQRFTGVWVNIRVLSVYFSAVSMPPRPENQRDPDNVPAQGSSGIGSLKMMEVHLTPDLEKKLHELASQTGRGADELARDAIAGFVDAVGEVRGMLNSRYDELKSGRVQPIDGDEAFRRLRQRSDNRRA